jgi:hypothetical protein
MLILKIKIKLIYFQVKITFKIYYVLQYQLHLITLIAVIPTQNYHRSITDEVDINAYEYLE